MNTLRTLTPWVLFLIMSVIAAFFWHQSDERGRRIGELSIKVDEINAQISGLNEDIGKLRSFVETAKALQQQEPVVTEAPPATEAPIATPAPPPENGNGP